MIRSSAFLLFLIIIRIERGTLTSRLLGESIIISQNVQFADSIVHCLYKNYLILYNASFPTMKLMRIPDDSNIERGAKFPALPPIKYRLGLKWSNFTMTIEKISTVDEECKKYYDGTLFVINRATQFNLFHLGWYSVHWYLADDI